MKYLQVMLLALATFGIASPAFGAGESAKPNVIFILADDLGYGDLSCYGQQKVPTPHIDRLAAEGLRFTDFYAGSTVCAPSRCSLMTGLHTGHCRVRGNALVPLEPEDVTVAELFKQAGYTTGLVGKWGLGEPDTSGVPNKQGFDYFFGYLNQKHAHDYYPTYLWRNQDKVELTGNLNNQRQEYSHDLFTAEALAFVAKNNTSPFFLYLAYTIPHVNNERQRDEGMGMEVPDYGPYADRREWNVGEKGHAAMIYRMDRDIGRLMARLGELGIDKNTLVMFTSDNGPHKEGGFDPEFFDSNGPLRGIKRDLYDGGIRVPMIARWPERISPGVSRVPFAFWDVMPTLAQIIKINPPKNIDGFSFLPTLLGKAASEQKQHDYFYWEFHERGFYQGVRLGNYKGIRRDKGSIELYDIASDIGEQKNIAAEHADVVERIGKIMNAARTESEHWPVNLSPTSAKKKRG